MKKKPLSARKPSNKNNSSLESPLEIKTFNDLEWDLAEGINFNVGPDSFKKYTFGMASTSSDGAADGAADGTGNPGDGVSDSCTESDGPGDPAKDGADGDTKGSTPSPPQHDGNR